MKPINSEKLKTYNQTHLAILGTLIVAGVVVVFLSGVFMLGSEVIGSRRGNDHEENSPSIKVQDSTQQQATGTKLRQNLTFGEPNLVDTAGLVYLIPVSLNSNKKEYDNRYEVLDYGISSFRGGKYLQYEGAYCNIIVNYQASPHNRVMFDQLINISNFRSVSFKGKVYVLIKGSTRDTNHNGKLNENDLQSFFVYNVAAQELKEISFPHMGLTDYTVMYQSDQIVLNYGVDQNKDGVLTSELTVLKKYSLTSKQASDLLDHKLVTHLEKLVN